MEHSSFLAAFKMRTASSVFEGIFIRDIFVDYFLSSATIRQMVLLFDRLPLFNSLSRPHDSQLGFVSLFRRFIHILSDNGIVKLAYVGSLAFRLIGFQIFHFFRFSKDW